MGDHQPKKKVLVIGTSGAVGMATRDAITQYTGANVIAYDRPLPNDPQERSKKETDRAAKVETYNQLVEANGRLLDGEQAKWLLRDFEKLPEVEQGSTTIAEDYADAIRSGVDVIVIAAGKPRDPKKPRDAIATDNAPDFVKYGEAIGHIAAEEIAKNPDFHLPVIINAGNPMDTMTEMFGRQLHKTLAEHAAKEPNTDIKRRLIDEARSLNKKILGQGGVLDGARVATALREMEGLHIPYADVVSAPVLGTHNTKMVPDFAHTMIRYKDGVVALTEHPEIDLNAPFVDRDKPGTPPRTVGEEIIERTRNGGQRIGQDYNDVMKLDQTAVLATGAAIMKMVDSVINDKKLEMPTAMYHMREPSEYEAKDRFKAHRTDGFLMGAMATLGREGATYREPSAEMKMQLAAAEQNARSEVGRVSTFLKELDNERKRQAAALSDPNREIMHL